MGLLDSLKKTLGFGKTKYDISINVHIPDYEAQLQEKVNEIHRKAKKSILSANGLRPNEIVFLSYAPKFSTTQTEFPQYWYYEMAIDEPRKLLDRLESQGFIEPASASVSLASLKVPELKEMLTELSLPTAGKKVDLIDRLCGIAPKDYLDKKVPIRNYCHTDLGKTELAENDYAVFFGKSYKYGFDIWEMNEALNKNPLLTFNDIIWQKLNTEAAKLPSLKAIGDYDNYIFIKENIGHYLLETQQFQEAFYYLSEATYYSIMAKGVKSFRVSVESARQNKGDIPEFQIYCWVDTAAFKSLQKGLNISNEEMYIEMVEMFSEFSVPQKVNNVLIPREVLSNEDVAGIIMFTLEKNEDSLNGLYKKAEQNLLKCKLPVWKFN